MRKKFKRVGVGGTFDELHKGHRALLSKAFDISECVMIGLTSDDFAKNMEKPHETASFEERARELKNFLKQQGLLQRSEIISIADPYGGIALSKNIIEALVVSKETQPVALEINRKRKEIGLNELKIIVIDMIPSDNHTAISTTRIRKGEIDREGHILRSQND